MAQYALASMLRCRDERRSNHFDSIELPEMRFRQVKSLSSTATENDFAFHYFGLAWQYS